MYMNRYLVSHRCPLCAYGEDTISLHLQNLYLKLIHLKENIFDFLIKDD